jgi:hypothetical protein
MTKISFGYLVKWQVCCGVTLGLARGIFFSKVLYFFFSHFNGITNLKLSFSYVLFGHFHQKQLLYMNVIQTLT